ncbi:hypothetical protein [Gloeobacter morelensis]|uniref:Transporter n=1 Tax=Gloeobacter morelensis MG652769 TaxID=2781736 RepID=A0ABY3PG45_9CYAN|nr:hypothetical protein [Gloeobacter morelensis]UFP92614.1 hypothetical protein ISF26_12235 [Gloeobacter morelensis MG652769]
MPSFWSVLLGVASLVLGENLDENLQQVNTSFDQLLNQGVLSPSLTSAAASVNGNFNELSAVLGIEDALGSASLEELKKLKVIIPDSVLTQLEAAVGKRFGPLASVSDFAMPMSRAAARRVTESMMFAEVSDPATGDVNPPFMSASGSAKRAEAIQNLNNAEIQLQDQVSNWQQPALGNALGAYTAGRSAIDQMPAVTAGAMSAVSAAATAAQSLPSTQLVLKEIAKELEAMGQLHSDIANQQAASTSQELQARWEATDAERTAANVNMFNARLLTELLKRQASALEFQGQSIMALNQIGAIGDEYLQKAAYEKTTSMEGALDVAGLVRTSAKNPAFGS